MRALSRLLAFAFAVILIFGSLESILSSDVQEGAMGFPAGWTNDIRITNNTEPDLNFAISTYGSDIHVSWRKFLGGQWKIFYSNSKDSGKTWSNEIELATPRVNPDIATGGNNVHLVSDSLEIYYRNSTDGGDNWNPEKMISVNDGNASEGPKVAVSEDGQNVHVVWVDSRFGFLQSEVYYKRSTDGGITWDDALGNPNLDRRITYDLSGAFPYSIEANGSNLHVLFGDDRDGSFDLYYARSTDNGVTWEDGLGNINQERKLTSNATDHAWSDMAVNGSSIHVVWADQVWPAPDYYIYYRNSTDNGATWSPTQMLVNSGTAISPSIDAVGNEVHVTWNDWRGATTEIYYINSTDGGITWNTELQLTSDDGFSSGGGIIKISGTNKHLVFGDVRDGNDEIYYKRFPDFPVVDTEPPEINHTPIPSANIDQLINITVNITDDVSVNQVYLDYTGVNATNYNVSMNQWNGNWSYDIPGQAETGFVDYFIWANDTSNNTNMTTIYQIQINDVTDPDINHLPVASANVFEVINITANITDDVAVNKVFLDYTGVNGTNYNVSMQKWNGNWSYDIPGQTSTGTVDYFIWANDTSDNDNMTLVRQIQINDITKPEINHAPVTSVNIGEIINITANITDDIGVNKIFLNYTDVQGINQNISMNQWNGNYSFDILGQGNSGFASYFIWANDTSDNDNMTQTYQIQIYDVTDPVINHMPITSANVSEIINITANVTDDVSVSSVYMNYTGVNGTNYNVSMVKWNGNYSYEILGQNTIGTVQYFIWANDSNGNDNRTIEYSIPINDVVKPEINHVPVVSANVGELINITVNVTDDVEVDKVFLNYTDVDDYNYNMIMNKYNDNWSYEISGQNNIGFVDYFIWVNDTSGNDNKTQTYQIQILDVVKPEFGLFWVSTLDDDTLNVTIEVTDDVAVDSVYMNYTDLQGINHNVSMTQWNGNWSYAMLWPYQEVGEIECFLWANDTSGNENISFPCSIIQSDIYSPSVVSHTPSGINVSVSTVITITFDEPMDKTSVESAITISPAITISGYSWDADNTTITITTSGNLSYNTTYNVTVGIGAKDVAGNGLENPYSWEFTTELQPITNGPDDGGIGEWWWILLIFIIVTVLALVAMKRKKKKEEETEEYEVPIERRE